MKVASIVGARPQFIKAAPVSKEIRKEHEEILIHTGQHYDYHLSKIIFDDLNVPEPDYNLNIGSFSHGEQTGRMLIELEKVLLQIRPDLVLVYGDTNSTLAGALAASKLQIPLGHIEAGLRSFDRSMPEEINRILADHASNILFAPTKKALDNLTREGINNGVYLTGDVMYDALLYNIKIAERSQVLEKLDLDPKEYMLATVHRQSNTDNPENLASILDAFSELDKRIIFPLHPRTEKFIKSHGLEKMIDRNITITRPLGYLDFLWLEKNAAKILTDSGGVQKEAYILKVPCITLRDSTEWVETVEDGWNVLTGADKNSIIERARTFEPIGNQGNVFGDGKASKKICDIINHLGANLSRNYKYIS